MHLDNAATMDQTTCHVIYVNRNIRQDRFIRSSSEPSEPAHNGLSIEEDGVLGDDVRLLLQLNDVHVCSSGSACIAKIVELADDSMMDLTPTVVLIDTTQDEIQPPTPDAQPESPRCSPSRGGAGIYTPDEDAFGLKLLQRILTESHLRSLAKLVVPILVLSAPTHSEDQMHTSAVVPDSTDLLFSDRSIVRRCLDIGAADVLLSPFSSKSVLRLEAHAYRAYREAAKEQQALLEVRRGRKRSWVGVNEEKPFAYLREAMVSGLMGGICKLGTETEDRVGHAKVAVSHERRADIAIAVGRWHFCAHDFNDDELIVAALIIFRHALTMPELERWRIPTDQLINFLMACRAAYNSFVPFHNFRHVVDVLQATFHFLVHVEVLPPYPHASTTPLGSSPPPSTGVPTSSTAPREKSPMASLLQPFDALTLLITAIGHDVGHPGVNNGFLVTLNAPLAQLYNDRSVLESFHCAAYSQVLRRYWPAAFEDAKMRNLMISSILATDMGLHFDYMRKLADVQAKLQDKTYVEGLDARSVEEHRSLACSLLIKCADISNAARQHPTAIQWMTVLSDEFSRQASMEAELEIKSSLLAPPKQDMSSRCQAQLGFMNLFAIPLFQGVADIMPAMGYTVHELQVNKALFEKAAKEAEASSKAVEASAVDDESLSPKSKAFPNTSSTSAMPPTHCVYSEGMDDVFVNSTMCEQNTTTSDEGEILLEDTGPAREVNGIVTNFDSVADFAASDPFNVRGRNDSNGDSRSHAPRKQRCSETTEGSTGPYSGDWASQVTSATTGKMPLSPSTQGTSIVSKESLERPSSRPRTVYATPPEPKNFSEMVIDAVVDDESTSNGSIGKGEGKSLKKRPSRFRMNAFPFFRRHKGASPPMPSADTTT